MRLSFYYLVSCCCFIFNIYSCKISDIRCNNSFCFLFMGLLLKDNVPTFKNKLCFWSKSCWKFLKIWTEWAQGQQQLILFFPKLPHSSFWPIKIEKLTSKYNLLKLLLKAQTRLKKLQVVILLRVFIDEIGKKILFVQHIVKLKTEEAST